MTKNTIWITGATGSMGSALVKKLEEDIENRIFVTDRDVDITDKQLVDRTADLYKPNIIINCAGISDKKYCEEHRVEAYRVNALGARNLASAARKQNAKMIQFSTDDVFSGKEPVYVDEYDVPDARMVYGKSNIAGENYVRELNPKHLIIRSSWVYGMQREGKDYFSYVAEKGRKGEAFTAPYDEIGTPTSAYTLADFISVLINEKEYGIFHAACVGKCTRFEFAQAILRGLGYDENLVTAVKRERPLSILLDNLMMEMTGVYTMPTWQVDLERYIALYKTEQEKHQ